MLNQKHFFDQRQFQIFESNFFYYEKKIGSQGFSFNIPFEDLTNVKILERNNSLLILGLSVFFYVVSAWAFVNRNTPDFDKFMWIYHSLIATFGLVSFIYLRERTWKIRLAHGNYIRIYADKPNVKTVDDFLENLYSKRNAYLKKTYLNFSKAMSYEDQLHNLKWLKGLEIISNEELDKKSQELKELFNSHTKVVGFRS